MAGKNQPKTVQDPGDRKPATNTEMRMVNASVKKKRKGQ